MIKEYYDILSLKRDASSSDIAQQYKRLVLRWHPRFAKQQQKTAHYHFSQISQAYQVLSDPLKRAFYDHYGYLKLKQGLFSQGQLKGGYRFSDNPDEIFQKFYQEHNPLSQSIDNDIIQRGSIFGHSYGGLNYQGQDKLQDLIVEIKCNLHELYIGVSKIITYQRRILNLDGRTTSLKHQQRLLQIKPGYNSIDHLIYKNQGHESITRTKSNLIIKIIQQQHSSYIRKQNNLIYTMNIKLLQALDCKNIQIITLDNRILRISIDQIIKPNTIKIIDGEGIQFRDMKKGSLYIKFNILFPGQISNQKKEELRRLLS